MEIIKLKSHIWDMTAIFVSDCMLTNKQRRVKDLMCTPLSTELVNHVLKKSFETGQGFGQKKSLQITCCCIEIASGKFRRQSKWH